MPFGSFKASHPFARALAVAAIAALSALTFRGPANAEGTEHACRVGGTVEAGPQSPRHIDAIFEGTNRSYFEPAPHSTELNLCNLHYHLSAEHRSFGFVNFARYGGTGFECSSTNYMAEAQKQAYAGETYCGEVTPGSTIEVHWVFTSCPEIGAPSGEGLPGACKPEHCDDPVLRVESQVFLLVNHDPDENGFRPSVPPGLGEVESFEPYGSVVKTHYRGQIQPERLPSGSAVTYLGSTTGPHYNNDSACSPAHVTWNVRTACRTIDIRTFHEWCRTSKFFRHLKDGKVEAHGVRPLVEDAALLAPMPSGEAR
ncbi:MAG: cadmium carbonic anhydrase [Rhizobiales bacterium]|nr:cadmium carbonic anhydrase [Hyphomicrobiales bacterium]